MRQPRQKSEAHLAFIRGLPCVVCGNNIETQAAHVRLSAIHYGKRYVGKGEKPDDKWTVPLCGRCHDEQHKRHEGIFWEEKDIDPVVTALALWAATGNHELGEQIVRSCRQ